MEQVKKIRVLWFSPSSAMYSRNRLPYHGVGWIESLFNQISKISEIELGVVCFTKTDHNKKIINGTTFYPITRKSVKHNPIKAIYSNWTGQMREYISDADYLDIIEDFKPDLIHVFGTEEEFINVHKVTNVPVVVQLQGILAPIVNAYMPPSFSLKSLLFSFKFFWSSLIGNTPYFTYLAYSKRVERENLALKNVRYIIGRTTWDRNVVELINPQVQYFHVNELLRATFYENAGKYVIKSNDCLKIVSTLSPTIYKGIDVVLKCAQLLKQHTTINFEWDVVGLSNNSKVLHYFEDKLNCSHKNLSVNFVGVKNEKELVNMLLNSSVYVHPTYIDNSPNSVCEAQILGLPVIATNVGGMASLIEDGKSGILVPANGTSEIVHNLILIMKQLEFGKKIGVNGVCKAVERHNKEQILKNLLICYEKIKDIN